MWLQNLQYRHDDEQAKWTWTRNHTAVETDRLLALTGLTVDFIRTLWAAGRARFQEAAEHDEAVPVVVSLDLPSIELVQATAYERGHRIERMTVDLQYTDSREQRIIVGGGIFPPPE
jgi:hypothetical protein